MRHVSDFYLMATQWSFVMLLSVKKKVRFFFFRGSLTWSEYIKPLQALQVNKGEITLIWNFSYELERRERSEKRSRESRQKQQSLPKGNAAEQKGCWQVHRLAEGRTPPRSCRWMVSPSAREHLGDTHLTLRIWYLLLYCSGYGERCRSSFINAI